MEAYKLNHAHAKVHGSVRELAWLGFATCMVQLPQVHGWTFRIAWFSFRRCMGGLKIPQSNGRNDTSAAFSFCDHSTTGAPLTIVTVAVNTKFVSVLSVPAA